VGDSQSGSESQGQSAQSDNATESDKDDTARESVEEEQQPEPGEPHAGQDDSQTGDSKDDALPDDVDQEPADEQTTTDEEAEKVADEIAEDDEAVTEAPLDALRLFAEAYNRIKLNYVEPAEDKTLIESAIRGMLSGLDPHSDLLVREDYDDLQESTQGEFGGLGIEISGENGLVKVIAPMDDTPAQKAGVKAGDLIIKLDDKPVKGMSLNKSVEMMRGKPGTKIVLTILREGEQKPLEITVERDIIHVASVKGRLLDKSYAYLRISNFQTSTARDLLDKIQDIQLEADSGVKGVVLDLRNNPGGILDSAVAVSDIFLGEGIIVYTEGRSEDSKIKYAAKSDDIIDGAPMVVLVNGGSASASEIVAGALQDHKRAVVMGTQTFGKGSVQTVVPVAENTAIKLTTARYYTPHGRSIQAEGITPDIVLEDVSVEVNGKKLAVKEKDLSGHLENDTTDGQETEDGQSSDEEAGVETVKDADKPADLITSDYALKQAMNLLKGLAILQQAQIETSEDNQ
jgi:carboxyl-terminal processing protease